MKTRNSEVLKDFVKFCEEAPELRFWQALSNWTGKIIYAQIPEDTDFLDTFMWETKDDTK